MYAKAGNTGIPFGLAVVATQGGQRVVKTAGIKLVAGQYSIGGGAGFGTVEELVVHHQATRLPYNDKQVDKDATLLFGVAAEPTEADRTKRRQVGPTCTGRCDRPLRGPR